MSTEIAAKHGFVIHITPALCTKIGLSDEDFDAFDSGDETPLKCKVSSFFGVKEESFYVYRHLDGEFRDSLIEGEYYIVWDESVLFTKVRTVNCVAIEMLAGVEVEEASWTRSL